MGTRRSTGFVRRFASSILACVMMLLAAVAAPANAASGQNQSSSSAWHASNSQSDAQKNDISVSSKSFGSGFLAAIYATFLQFKQTLSAAFLHLWKLSHPGQEHTCA